ncbi:hypothetical protein C351_00232 [Cryptococcus neoformans c8]|nr:hypothetical protein C351_00232 [Cryptococcus neoformans var. grubii c8]
MLKRNVRKSIYGKLSEIRTKLKEDRLRIREQLEDHFKQTLAAQKAIDEESSRGGLRWKRNEKLVLKDYGN